MKYIADDRTRKRTDLLGFDRTNNFRFTGRIEWNRQIGLPQYILHVNNLATDSVKKGRVVLCLQWL